VAPDTAELSVTVAEVEVAIEETLDMTGVVRLVPVRTKGVPEPTLVHIVPVPGKVEGVPVRSVLATVSFHVPFG
jgi:hypothetical protein